MGTTPDASRAGSSLAGHRCGYPMGAVPGDEQAQPEEQPRHLVRVLPFYVGRTEVTRAQLRRFVEATGYEAEGASSTIPAACGAPGGRRPTAVSDVSGGASVA